MKKHSLIFVSLVTLFCICFTSCENGNGDDLKGVWKFVPEYYASTYGYNNCADFDMTYVFDGKGNYTFKVIDSEQGTRNAKGTYDHLADSKLVRLHEVYINAEGITKEYDNDIWLDVTVKPATLTCDRIFNGDERYTFVFEKQ